MSNHAMRPRRILAGVLAGAMAITASPILGFTGVASAQTEADPLGAGNFCEDVPQTEPFSDITAADPAFGHIVCLVATEITVGFPDGTYRPLASTTRRQMALFLTRLADEADRLEVGDSIEELPEYDGTPDFSDHAAEEADQEAAIGQLNQAGIASGFPDGEYKGGASVSRRQMATFIYNLYEFLTGAPLPVATEDHFADDNADSAEQQARTNAVAEAGIFIGNADGTFAPSTPINRRQMARVMTRTLQVLFENGEITQWAAEDANNQDFGTTQGENLVTFTTPAGTGGSRDIVFSGVPAGTVDVALFHCGDSGEDPAVSIDGNGVATFRDEEGASAGRPDNLADDEGETTEGNAFIVSINGDPAGAASTYEDEVAVPAGNVTVRVNSMDVDCVFVVVFADADDDDELDLDASNQPTEAFGVAGPLVWFFGEAINGYDMEGDVVYHNASEQFWIDDSGFLMNYGRANDRYYLDCFSDALEINLADWTAYLTTGDNTSDDQASYNRAGPNQFENEGDYPLAPASVTVAVGDFDATADTAADDVRVTVVEASPTGGDIEFYTVNRYNSTTGAFIDSEDTADGATTADFEELAPGTYLFRAFANTECGNSGDLTDPVSATVAAPPPGAVVGAPFSVSASPQDADSSASLNVGDVLTVRFNEVMAAPGAGDTIEVTDPDGTIADIVNGTNSTWALSADGATITITMTAGPTITTIGTTVGVQYPAEVTGSTGVTDADEALEWDLVASTDTTF